MYRSLADRIPSLGLVLKSTFNMLPLRYSYAGYSLKPSLNLWKPIRNNYPRTFKIQRSYIHLIMWRHLPSLRHRLHLFPLGHNAQGKVHHGEDSEPISGEKLRLKRFVPKYHLYMSCIFQRHWYFIYVTHS